MSLVTILLAGFFLLGVLVGPLAVAGLAASLSDSSGRKVGDWAVGLGLKSVWRPALTFNAANELTLKRRSYDENHDEQKISFGGLFSGVERFLFDPRNRIHDFFGTPFAFVDEKFGIILDPRDAAVGRELRKSQEAGTYTTRVERGENLVESVQAVFELPKPNVGVRLPDVWTLIGGSFDAQLVRKIDEFYQKSQAPKASTTALRQLLVPVGSFIAIVLLGMFAAGQGGGGGAAQAAAGGGGGSTVEIGESWLLLLAIPALKDVDRRDAVVGTVFGGVSLLIVVGLLIAFPPTVTLLGIPLPLGVWAVVATAVGAAIIPFIAAWFGRSLGGVGMLLGKLFITIGLLSYDRPVITLVDKHTYRLVEFDEVDWPVKPQFYRFALTRLGVGFANSEDVWDEDVSLSPARVNEMANGPVAGDPIFDGGSDTAPSGYTTTSIIEHEGIRGYVPETVDKDSRYVRTDLVTGWFMEAGQNRRLMKAALDTAKERHGGGQKPVDDKYVLGATLLAMVMGALFDYMVFF